MKQLSRVFTTCLFMLWGGTSLAQQPFQAPYFSEAEYGAEANILNMIPPVPDYSCTAKLTQVESIICNTTELAVADRIMVKFYKNEMSQATEEQKSEIKKNQLQFLKERSLCTDAPCVLKKTQQRVADFSVPTEQQYLAALNKLKVPSKATSLKTPIEFLGVVGYRLCIYGQEKLKCDVFNRFGAEEIPVPERVLGLRKISLSGTTVCLLAGNGLNCYGYCKDGKICNVPNELKNGFGITDLAVGKEHACVVKNAKVICWGDNQFQQINVPMNIANIKSVYVGVANTCVVNTLDQIRCWGANDDGINDVPQFSAPVKKIDMSGSHACALLQNGQVTCWGINEAGNSKGFVFGQSKSPSNNSEYTDLSVGRTFNCGVRQNTMVCWGDQKVIREFPKNLKGVKQVGSGEYHVCALLENGVSCWGKYEDANGKWLSAERYRPITLD